MPCASQTTAAQPVTIADVIGLSPTRNVWGLSERVQRALEQGSNSTMPPSDSKHNLEFRDFYGQLKVSRQRHSHSSLFEVSITISRLFI